MDYLKDLNENQKKAVLATDGPVLIVAGAGAGKTKTLAYRMLHLIKAGIHPENILAITFTNKAGKEMRERVFDLIKNDISLKHLHGLPTVCTFHSLGVKIIKENSSLLKLPRHFAIFDKADSKKALKDALVYVGVEPKEHIEKIQHIISTEKSRGHSLSDFLERDAFDYTTELTAKAWRRYEEILTRDSALDFDDLLLKTLWLLKKPDILEKYQNRFLYIHVDEYQDTNKIQNEIVELLAHKHKNICVVGDTDQNIYSWRGADIKHMLHFEKIYPNTQTFFLEENYRSTQTILSVANNIIEKNNIRIPKKLFTQNSAGEKIGLFTARDEMDEAHFIALKAKELIEQGAQADEIAVLFRANFQSRALEEAFLAYNVPYQMLGTKFFERKEIKDVLSYVKVSLNPENLGDFARAVSVPPRGIGKTTIEKIVGNLEHELSAGVQEKIQAFRYMLETFKKILQTEKPSKALIYILQKSGMEKMYATKNEDDVERLENIMELVTLASRYDEFPPEEGMELFLTDTSLTSDQDSLDNTKNGVKLMTVHSSKGLEFDYVFISGLEADLFPHKGFGNGEKQQKSKEDSEEERRLFYVALTRARRKVFLTHADTRTIFGKTEINAPSEFLDDIDVQYIEKESYGEKKNGVFFSIDF